MGQKMYAEAKRGTFSKLSVSYLKRNAKILHMEDFWNRFHLLD
jgi:hypothetical protein